MPIQSNDFKSNSLTGTVQVDGGAIAIPIRTNRLVLEGNKSFVVKLRKSNESGEIIATTPTITLTDNTSVVAFYSNVGISNEGQLVEFSLITANVPNNYSAYYVVSGTTGNVNSEDIDPFAGLITITNNSANLLLDILADESGDPDDNESFVVQLKAEPSAEVIASSNVVYINDTSNTVRLINITTEKDSVLSGSYSLYETEGITINLYTINGDGENAGNLYYTISGNTFTNDEVTSGVVSISNNYGNIFLIPESNVFLNEIKNLNVQIRRNSISGDIVGYANLLVYNYVTGVITPLISRVVNLYPNITYALANAHVVYNLNMANSSNTETLFYRTTGNLTTFAESTNTGTVNISGNTASFTIKTLDTNLDTPKTLNVLLYRNNSANAIIGIGNVEVQVVPNYEILQYPIFSSENYIEGQSLLIDLVTDYGIPGETPFYYSISGNATIVGDAFGEGNSSTGFEIIAETNIPDEEQREFIVRIRTDSVSGPIVYTSNVITVSSFNKETDTFIPSVSIVTDISGNFQENITELVPIYANVTTVGASENETLYYTIHGNIVMTDSVYDGSFNLSSNTAQLIFGNYDVPDYEQATFQLKIRRNSNTGPILAESNVGYIQGVGPSVYSLTAPSDIVYDTDEVFYTLEVANVKSGTNLYITSNGAIYSTVSNVQYTDNSTILISVINDNYLEPAKGTLDAIASSLSNVHVRLDSNSGNIVATATKEVTRYIGWDRLVISSGGAFLTGPSGVPGSPYINYQMETSGTFSFYGPTFSARYLAVGGGGGGGGDAGGGGGGGGVKNSTVTIPPGTPFVVTIGAGGVTGYNGGNTTITSPVLNWTSQGGGGGGSYFGSSSANGLDGNPGGNGGGGSGGEIRTTLGGVGAPTTIGGNGRSGAGSPGPVAGSSANNRGGGGAGASGNGTVKPASSGGNGTAIPWLSNQRNGGIGPVSGISYFGGGGGGGGWVPPSPTAIVYTNGGHGGGGQGVIGGYPSRRDAIFGPRMKGWQTSGGGGGGTVADGGATHGLGGSGIFVLQYTTTYTRRSTGKLPRFRVAHARIFPHETRNNDPYFDWKTNVFKAGDKIRVDFTVDGDRTIEPNYILYTEGEVSNSNFLGGNVVTFTPSNLLYQFWDSGNGDYIGPYTVVMPANQPDKTFNFAVSRLSDGKVVYRTHEVTLRSNISGYQ